MVRGRITQIKFAMNLLIGASEGSALYEGAEPVGYAEVLHVEVPPNAFPASTLMFSYPSQSDWATGGITQNEWRFIQRSYFDFTDPERAQLEMEALIPALLASIRRAEPDDLVLEDGTFFELIVEDAGDPDVGEAGGSQMLIKSLYLTARTEEI